jgi:hypothetical protein
MFWQKKINSKSYVAGTCINLAFALFFGLPELKDALSLVLMVLCSVGNHIFMVYALNSLIESQLYDGDAVNKKKLFGSIVGKTLFLVVGFVCLIKFSPNKVLQALSLYIFQLIILGLKVLNNDAQNHARSLLIGSVNCYGKWIYFYLSA